MEKRGTMFPVALLQLVVKPLLERLEFLSFAKLMMATEQDALCYGAGPCVVDGRRPQIIDVRRLHKTISGVQAGWGRVEGVRLGPVHKGRRTGHSQPSCCWCVCI